MTQARKTAACTAALAVMGLALLPPTATWAGADGRKNTTIALGAAAAWELLHHQTLAGVALGAGAVYAEKKYEDARRSERDQTDRRYYGGIGRDTRRGSSNGNARYGGGGGGYRATDNRSGYGSSGYGSSGYGSSGYGSSGYGDRDSENTSGGGWDNSDSYAGDTYAGGANGPRYYRTGGQSYRVGGGQPYATDGNTRYPGGRPTPFSPAPRQPCDDTGR